MKIKQQRQQFVAAALASAVLVLPLVAMAHGGVSDGDVDADGHSEGASALMKAGSPRWLGLLAFSVLSIGGLSYGVWKYLQVAPPKKIEPAAPPLQK